MKINLAVLSKFLPNQRHACRISVLNLKFAKVSQIKIVRTNIFVFWISFNFSDLRTNTTRMFYPARTRSASTKSSIATRERSTKNSSKLKTKICSNWNRSWQNNMKNCSTVLHPYFDFKSSLRCENSCGAF